MSKHCVFQRFILIICLNFKEIVNNEFIDFQGFIYMYFMT